MRSSQFIPIRPNSLLLLILIVAGSSLFSGCGATNLEIIVPHSETPRTWRLSPGGDKIVYESHAYDNIKTFLLFLATQQKREFDNCYPFTWLDNTTLMCPNFITTTDDFAKVPFKEGDFSSMDLQELLQKAGTIYRFEGNDSTLFVFNKNNPDKNYVVNNIKNIDVVLQQYTYVTVPTSNPAGNRDEKVYSPNNSYYYVYDGVSITIHNAADDKELARFSEKDTTKAINLGGWAADSSGVYFQFFKAGFFLWGEDLAIKKLKVPQ